MVKAQSAAEEETVGETEGLKVEAAVLGIS